MKTRPSWAQFLQDKRIYNTGLTQKQFAESVGLSEKAIIQYENGLRMPSYIIMLRLCDALGVNQANFIEECDKQEYINKALNDMLTLIWKYDDKAKIGLSKTNYKLSDKFEYTSLTVLEVLSFFFYIRMTGKVQVDMDTVEILKERLSIKRQEDNI